MTDDKLKVAEAGVAASLERSETVNIDFVMGFNAGAEWAREQSSYSSVGKAPPNPNSTKILTARYALEERIKELEEQIIAELENNDRLCREVAKLEANFEEAKTYYIDALIMGNEIYPLYLKLKEQNVRLTKALEEVEKSRANGLNPTAVRRLAREALETNFAHREQ